MKSLLSTTLMSIFIIGIIHAQNGKFMAAASLHEVDCEQQKVYVDLKIKAADSDSYFFLAQQNYRLTFNSILSVDSVSIENELEISGIVQTPSGIAMYSPHVLTGTRDTVISYSLELMTGDGYFVTDDNWVSIGRIGLGIADMTGCLKLRWNDQQTFPITYISETWNSNYYDVTDSTYIDLEVCLPEYCSAGNQLTDITELSDESYDIQVVPTLVQHELTIQYSFPQDISSTDITIVDMQGNVLQRHQKLLTTKDEYTFDVSHLPQGIYLINTQINGQWIPRKFVKIQ